MSFIREVRNDIEREAFRLIREYHAMLVNEARGLGADEQTAEDLAFKTIETYLAKRESELPPAEKLRSWLLGTIRNHYLHSVRGKARACTVYLDQSDIEKLQELGPVDNSTDEAIIAHSDAEFVRKVLASLPEETRRVIVLHYFESLSIREIAALLARTPDSVKCNLYYARKVLAKRLGKALGRAALAIAALLFGGSLLYAAAVATGLAPSPFTAAEPAADLAPAESAGGAESSLIGLTGLSTNKGDIPQGSVAEIAIFETNTEENAMNSSMPKTSTVRLATAMVAAALPLGSVLGGSSSGCAEGGEVTLVGVNKDAVHSFTNIGANTFTLFAEKEVWFLVVGGGGGGGYDCSGGGGGGGFVESNSVVLAAGTYTVTVGAGGVAGASGGQTGGNGGDSIISLGGIDIARAIGGGGGGAYNSKNGVAGGSGGGGTTGGAAGAGTEGQGFAGGGGEGGVSTSGGGGAGGVGGSSGDKTKVGGSGGPGKASEITGEEVYYAGGGGGGGYNNGGDNVNGGIGGGGNGARNVIVAARQAGILPDGRNEYEAEAGVDGLGGGGGGANNKDYVGRPGGSGVVIIRIPGDSSAMLEVLGAPDGIGSPSPAYGNVSGLSAGDAFAVSCGATSVTNEAATVAYSCVGWKLYDQDANVVSNGSETSFTYVHPTPAAYRKLEWQWSRSVVGEISAGAFGRVAPSGRAWYSCDTPVTVTATPDSGIGFAHWTGTLPAGIDSTATSVTFTVSEPFAMTARFGAAHYEMSVVGRGDILYTFFASGPFTLSRAENVRLLLVGGGGGGGYDCSGGGGGGGMIDTNIVKLAAGVYTVTVGNGGVGYVGATGIGNNGGNSVFALGETVLYTARGGGGGGSFSSGDGASGGSGGGASGGNNEANVGTGGAGTTGQGFAGGNATHRAMGGGGGAGGPGGDGTASQGPGAAGGIGRRSNITGEDVYYAGGGGGGGYNYADILQNGGRGGGGNGVRNISVAARKLYTLPDGRNEYEAEAGVDGLGGGGGGANNFTGDKQGRPGGRGTVIIRVMKNPGFILVVH